MFTKHIIALVALSLFVSFTVHAITWTGAHGSNWQVGSNWDEGRVPNENDDVIIPNTVNRPTIFFEATAKSIHLESGAQLTISPSIILTIKGGGEFGIKNYGELFNRGIIDIGTEAVWSGIENYGYFDNRGTIVVNRVTQYGIYNSSGLFENKRTIVIGEFQNNGSAITNFAAFKNVDASCVINIKRGSKALYNAEGTFENHGKFNIGTLAGAFSGNTPFINAATFENGQSGEITIDRCTGTALETYGPFTNAGKILIGASASVGDYGISIYESTFVNQAGGNIQIYQTATWDIEVEGDGRLENQHCASIYLTNRYEGVGTLINDGYLRVATTNAHASNPGADDEVTNNGVIEYPLGNPIPGMTNNGMIVQSTVTGVCTITNALQLAAQSAFQSSAVWYKDPALTQPAGEYDAATNTFTPGHLLSGAHTLYFSVPDADNDCSFTPSIKIIFTDIAPPVIVCPAHQTVSADANCGSDLGAWSAASVSDNCTANPTVSQSPAAETALSGHNDSETVTLTADDHHGNTKSCSFTVTLKDNFIPVPTCPASVTVTCSSQVPAVNLADVVAPDNCSIPFKSHVGDAISNQTCTNRFTVTRTYRATDGSGNSATCSQVITVYDDVKPNFTSVPANVTVQCNSIPAVGMATASDGCGGSVSIAYNGQSTTTGNCPDSYTLTRHWMATDACGNTKTATQRITVQDTQKPNFTSTPAHITVQCDAVPAPVSPAATDNCDASVAVTYNGQTQTNGACPNAYTLTRRWTAADNCGNTKTVTQRITVVDNGKPVFTAFPANSTIACHENPPAVGTPTASDGCGTATVTYLGQSTQGGSCPGNYQIKRTWRATDACGNSTVATQTIQVLDNDIPVFTSAPADVTIQCGQPMPPLVNPTASDACGYAFVTFLGNVPSGSGCSADYIVTRTWEAEDLCGNTASVSQVITVLGNNNAEEEGAESRENGATEFITYRSSLPVTPNPTSDRIWVDLSEFAGEAVTVSIFSDMGQLVWENSISEVETAKISVSLREAGAAAGIYTVSVRGAGEVVAKRVVLAE